MVLNISVESATPRSNACRITEKKSVNYYSQAQSIKLDVDCCHINVTNPENELRKLRNEGLYRPERKPIFKCLFGRKAQYTYLADGKECIAEIKSKFALRDGAIKRCNSQIRDDDWIPPKGYEIFFYEEDALAPAEKLSPEKKI